MQTNLKNNLNSFKDSNKANSGLLPVNRRQAKKE